MYDRPRGGGGRGGYGREERRPYPAHDRGGYGEDRYYDSPARRGFGGGRPRGRGSKMGGPRPWDYSRRPPPRNEQERQALENERRAWEAQERERWGPDAATQVETPFRRFPPLPPPASADRREFPRNDRDAAYAQQQQPPPYRYRSRSPPRAGYAEDSGRRSPSGAAGYEYQRYARPSRDATLPTPSPAQQAPLPPPTRPTGMNRWRSDDVPPPADENPYRHTVSSPQRHTQHSSPYASIDNIAAPPQRPAPIPAARHFSAAHFLCPELDAELLAIESQRTAFLSTFFYSQDHRQASFDLKEAELEHLSATLKVTASDKALDLAKESADAYSLEENRKEEMLALQQPSIST